MKKKFKINDLFYNDKCVLVLSFFIAVGIWLAVVINVSDETSRVIKGVKVIIDTTVPSQFDLEVFGNNDYTVDITVTGKKYQISNAALSAEDILVTAITDNVVSPGMRSLQLRAEDLQGRSTYKISATSLKTIDVYFDISKTKQFVIEPNLVADGFDTVADGYTCGSLNLSETTVDVTGPSAEINRISRVTADLKLDAPLIANKSVKAPLQLWDENNKNDFKYSVLNIEDVVLTIPVLRMKELETSVTFKNAPDTYVVAPLAYTINPTSDIFNVSVDDYDKLTSYSIGVIDFKNLSPTNHVFTFDSKDLGVVKAGETQNYSVNVDMKGIEQEFFTVNSSKFKVNGDKAKYNISELNKSIAVIGSQKEISAITDEAISVEIDLSELNLNSGQTVTVPAVVTVKNDSGCWVYGSYTVDVSC